MDELSKLFKEIGYRKEDYEEIVNEFGLVNLKRETLIKKVKENYKFLRSLGYMQEEVIKITKQFPSIYGLSIENMKQKIEDIKELGYTQEEVIKMTKTLPSIYSLSIETIKQKIEDIKKLGYKQEEVIKITKQFPSIYGLSIENMKQKIEDIKELGYTQEEVIKMTKTSPSIYGLSIENMKQKIEFYDLINLHSISVKVPSILMQSTKLSYARYQFLKEKGIEIDETNYRNLFRNQKHFEQQYGITKQELLEKYAYEEENSEYRSKRTKSTQDLGRESKKAQKNIEGIDEITIKIANRLKGIDIKEATEKENE